MIWLQSHCRLVDFHTLLVTTQQEREIYAREPD